MVWNSTNYYGKAATQTTGGYCPTASNIGIFGQGSFVVSSELTAGASSGGGGGFYGGGFGSGGSGYIANSNLTNKHMTCYECQTSDEVHTKTISNTCVSDNPVSDCSKKGHGYVKITFIG